MLHATIDVCASLRHCLASNGSPDVYCPRSQDRRPSVDGSPVYTSPVSSITMVSDLTLCCPCSCKAGKGKADEYYFNPLKCPLPKAPKMEMFCLYGVGIPTERSYYYLNLESEEVMNPICSEHGVALYCVVIGDPSLHCHRGDASSFTLTDKGSLNSAAKMRSQRL